jgi:hypothetical protein
VTCLLLYSSFLSFLFEPHSLGVGVGDGDGVGVGVGESGGATFDSATGAVGGAEGDFEERSRVGFWAMRSKVIQINRLYHKAMLSAGDSERRQVIRFWKAHPQGHTVPTYRQAHKELLAVFGSDGDRNEHADGAFDLVDDELEVLYQDMERAACG